MQCFGSAVQVQLMRTRDRAAELDFSEVLSEEVESEMKEAAAISMGTDISESDILNILALCEQARLRAPCLVIFFGRAVGSTLSDAPSGLYLGLQMCEQQQSAPC